MSKSSCAGHIWHQNILIQAAYDSVLPILFGPPTSAMSGNAAAGCQTQHPPPPLNMLDHHSLIPSHQVNLLAKSSEFYSHSPEISL